MALFIHEKKSLFDRFDVNIDRIWCLFRIILIYAKIKILMFLLGSI